MWRCIRLKLKHEGARAQPGAAPLARPTPRHADIDMKTTAMLLLALCACATGEPLAAALSRRNDVFGVYANDYTQEYEPVAIAAIPLHAPLSVLHILSESPLSSRRERPRHDVYRTLPYSQSVYAASMSHSAYASPYFEESAPTVLYARPTEDGGYTYRRRPNRNRPAPQRSPHPDDVIIRIHKYRIIRDR